MRCLVSALALAASLVLTVPADGADRTLTASGTIVRIDAKSRTLVVAVAEGSETAFVWTPETRIAGVMAAGARVTLRYTADDDGRNVAVQISVTRS